MKRICFIVTTPECARAVSRAFAHRGTTVPQTIGHYARFAVISGFESDVAAALALQGRFCRIFQTKGRANMFIDFMNDIRKRAEDWDELDDIAVTPQDEDELAEYQVTEWMR